ncbi:hypothetical protein DFH09DRAFT_1369159, partial [Mycena vulgaris]
MYGICGDLCSMRIAREEGRGKISMWATILIRDTPLRVPPFLHTPLPRSAPPSPAHHPTGAPTSPAPRLPLRYPAVRSSPRPSLPLVRNSPHSAAPSHPLMPLIPPPPIRARLCACADGLPAILSSFPSSLPRTSSFRALRPSARVLLPAPPLPLPQCRFLIFAVCAPGLPLPLALRPPHPHSSFLAAPASPSPLTPLAPSVPPLRLPVPTPPPRPHSASPSPLPPSLLHPHSSSSPFPFPACVPFPSPPPSSPHPPFPSPHFTSPHSRRRAPPVCGASRLRERGGGAARRRGGGGRRMYVVDVRAPAPPCRLGAEGRRTGPGPCVLAALRPGRARGERQHLSVNRARCGRHGCAWRAPYG